ncbi:MAG: hypothetical protein KJO20_00070 [Eudoraea sp.]|nr:hypothetical protein [Eudoraea sp.]NNK30781.1 hypothetical protein [Flavobacteriaceae bacterium]
MQLTIQKSKSLLSLIFLFLTFQVVAQDQNLTGSWEGTLTTQGVELPVIFNISKAEGGYSSTMDSPAQGATGIPMDETKVSGNEITILFQQSGIKYVAKLEGDKLQGTFYQAGLELPLKMTKVDK